MFVTIFMRKFALTCETLCRDNTLKIKKISKFRIYFLHELNIQKLSSKMSQKCHAKLTISWKPWKISLYSFGKSLFPFL